MKELENQERRAREVEEWRAKRQAYETSAEMAIHLRLRKLDRSKAIFDANRDDLLRDLDMWAKMGMLRGGSVVEGGRENRYRLMVETTRLLHNFVAAGVTYRDHVTAVVKRHYASTSELASFEAKRKSMFVESPVLNFLCLLRNQMLHVEVQPIGVNTRWQREQTGHPGGATLTNTIAIGIEHLKELKLRKGEYDGAKRYIENNAPEVKLNHFANNASVELESFHRWIFDALKRTHSKDLERLQKMNLELIELERR